MKLFAPLFSVLMFVCVSQADTGLEKAYLARTEYNDASRAQQPEPRSAEESLSLAEKHATQAADLILKATSFSQCSRGFPNFRGLSEKALNEIGEAQRFARVADSLSPTPEGTPNMNLVAFYNYELFMHQINRGLALAANHGQR